MILLTPKFGIPIEREFEGWIVQEIEQYFIDIGLKCILFANSPMNETHYPSDELLLFESKLIGLQFKAPHLRKKIKNSPLDLSWNLSQSNGNQFNTIKKLNEIYYCLPTFTNREIKSKSLNHCIFWRPNQIQKAATTYWYDNPKVKNNNGKVNSEGARWGEFTETIFSCTIGKILQKGSSVKQEISKIHNDYKLKNDEGLYFLILENRKSEN